MAEYVTEFDFATPGDYTPSGDAELSGGVLTLEDPLFLQIMHPKYWSPEFLYLDDDATPQNGTIHKALDGGATPVELVAQNGVWALWARSTEALSPGNMLTWMLRYAAPSTYLWLMLMHLGGVTKHAKVYLDSGLEVCRDELWGQDWTDVEWRQFLFWLDGDDLRFMLGARRDLWYRQCDLTDAGTLCVQGFDASQRFRIGADDGQPGNPSAKPCPYFAYRREGACELKEGSAWELPDHFQVFGRMAAISSVEYRPADLEGSDPGVLDVLPVRLQYDLNDGGGWSGWEDLPEDGDLSGASADPGDLFRWRIDDGAGAGMDNAQDPRYQPTVHKVLVGFQGTGGAGSVSTASRRNAVKAGPRRGDMD